MNDIETIIGLLSNDEGLVLIQTAQHSGASTDDLRHISPSVSKVAT